MGSRLHLYSHRCWIIYVHRMEHGSRTRHKLWLIGNVGETLFTVTRPAVAPHVVAQRHWNSTDETKNSNWGDEESVSEGGGEYGQALIDGGW